MATASSLSVRMRNYNSESSIDWTVLSVTGRDPPFLVSSEYAFIFSSQILLRGFLTFVLYYIWTEIFVVIFMSVSPCWSFFFVNWVKGGWKNNFFSPELTVSTEFRFGVSQYSLLLTNILPAYFLLQFFIGASSRNSITWSWKMWNSIVFCKTLWRLWRLHMFSHNWNVIIISVFLSNMEGITWG